MTDTLTVRDNRTGREYELAITDGTIRAADLKQIAVDGEPGLATYDPGFVNTASCRSAITFIDGDVGILEYRGYPIEQLAEHSTFLEVAYLLLERRAAHPGPAGRVGARHHLPHLHPREPEAVHRGLPLRRAPDGHADGLGQRAVHLLPDGEPDQRPGEPAAADHPDDRQDADPGRLRLPAPAGQAVRLPRQRAVLHRQLPGHAVQDERAGLRRGRAAGQGAGGAVHPARRPRAELLDQRGPLRRLVPGRPVLGGRRRRRRALRAAARRSQRGGAGHAAGGSAPPTTSRDFIDRGEGRQGAADGLRPPGLQELRPAGQRSSRRPATTSSR